MNVIADTISGRQRRKQILTLVATMLVIIYTLAPIAWVFVSSFQKEVALEERPPHFIPEPGILTLSHYLFIFTGKVPRDATIMIQAMYTMSGTFIFPAVINSIIIALFVTFINVVLGLAGGHTFARYRFSGDRPVFLLLLATRLLPAISIVVPMYILLQQFHLLDTKRALVGIYSAITLPFTIWILKAYFQNIPAEYEEAARMDGCGYFRTMWRVVIPLARPGIIAAAIFAFMTAYDEFVFATVLTHTMNSKTQTVVIAALAQGLSASRGLIAASAVVCLLPPVILAVGFRKYVVQGLTAKYL
jgi:multiple sugar transport system permease protein